MILKVFHNLTLEAAYYFSTNDFYTLELVIDRNLIVIYYKSVDW